MKTVFHPAGSRGHANHGWLNTHHTFSFARYYDPERINFGALRVLNDDEVAPGRGFARHPHDNMEIVSIPLSGDLEHEDSLGNVAVIREGDIQVMSAGTGVTHSEKNHQRDADVKFLQIWIFPRERDVAPRYDQQALDPAAERNQFAQVLSPNPDDAGVWINQDAWFHLGTFGEGREASYALKRPGNGVYVFLLEGAAEVAGQPMQRRDGLGISETDRFTVLSQAPGTRLLVMEVPMLD